MKLQLQNKRNNRSFGKFKFWTLYIVNLLENDLIFNSEIGLYIMIINLKNFNFLQNFHHIHIYYFMKNYNNVFLYLFVIFLFFCIFVIYL